MYLEKILTILKKNKYFSSARDILPKKARQIEKIAYLKKDHKFKDLCFNIELNVKELSKSRILSHKFLIGKLPVNFLLINHEKFCEKKEKIIKKILTQHQAKKIGKIRLSKEGNFNELYVFRKGSQE